MLHLPDVSDGETSDTNGGGTLVTISAKSINFVRPSQRLLEREHHKRLKQHKSFFNTESLFSKKSSVVRRAESFHQGPLEHRLSEAKQAGGREEARERAKSVDRMLPEDDPLQGSKTVFQIAFSSIKLVASLCGSEEGQQCTGDLSERFQTWIILESFRCYGRWQRHPSLTCKEYQVDVCIYKSLIFLRTNP